MALFLAFPKYKTYFQMKKIFVITTLLAFSLGLVSFQRSFTSTPPSNSVFYQGSYDNLFREAKKQNKLILLDFWAAWCSPCAKLDRETFTDKELGKFLGRDFLVYKVDIDSKEGKEIVEKYGVKVFPTLLAFNPKVGNVSNLKGFYPPNFLQKELTKIRNRNTIYNSKPDMTGIIAKK